MNILRNFVVVIVGTAFSHGLTPIAAQTVQLPTQRTYSTNSSVLVPDGGGVYLGGNSTVRSGSSRSSIPILGRLPIAGRAFQNRGFGQDHTSGNSWVTAQIIDLREWDEAVLAEARRQRAGVSPNRPQVHEAFEAEALFLSENMSRRPGVSRDVGPPRRESNSAAAHRTKRHLAPLRLGTASPTNR